MHLLDGPPSLGHTPSVVAFQRDPPAAILSEVEGRGAEDLDLTPANEERMWREAGAWLRRLHTYRGEWFGLVNPDGTPNGLASEEPVTFVRNIFDQRLRDGREMGLLDNSECSFVETSISEWLPSLEGETACAIHRDFSPRNWMAQHDGELTAIIDFEHARWDVQAADLNRWWDHEFLRNPELKHAFFEAYGQPDERLRMQIQTLRLLIAVGGVVWATKVDDRPFAKRNREALHRMMSE